MTDRMIENRIRKLQALEAQIAEIEKDCRNDPKYIQRIEDFYPYFDENSCQRVYEYICKIPQ